MSVDKSSKPIPLADAHSYVKRILEKERKSIYKSGYDKGFYDARQLFLDTDEFTTKLKRLTEVTDLAASDDKANTGVSNPQKEQS